MPENPSPRTGARRGRAADVDRDLFSDAIQTGMARKGISQNELADRVGVSQAAVSDWINKKSLPSRKNLKRIAEALDLPENFADRPAAAPAVASRRPPNGGVDRHYALQEIDLDQIVMVPRNGYASAGHGAANDENEEPEYDPYPRFELMRAIPGHPPNRLRSVTVTGDSLTPEILPNARVLYLPLPTISDDGLYVVEIDGLNKIKLVQRLGGGVLELIPLNTIYSRERFVPMPEADTPNTYRSELSGYTSTLRIIGKVVWYAKPA